MTSKCTFQKGQLVSHFNHLPCDMHLMTKSQTLNQYEQSGTGPSRRHI